MWLGASVCALIMSASDAGAFRMIQNTNPGRTSNGTRVLCSDPGGYTHWTTSSISWRLNPANQGGEAGVSTALQNAMTAWNNVTPASYALSLGGTTNAGFATD